MFFYRNNFFLFFLYLIFLYFPFSFEAGLPRAASAREADNLLRDAETFLSLAETALGVEVQSPLPLRPAG